MQRLWIVAAALILVLGAAGYTIAQSAGGEPQSGGTQMMGQSLTDDQLKEFADQHGITVDQARQMTDQCNQMMRTASTPETSQQ